MAYIRVKKIKDKRYAYLVENKMTSRGPRQKVKKYLGRVHKLQKDDSMEEKTFGGVFSSLVLSELAKLGFRKKGNNHVFKDLIFNHKESSLLRKTKSGSCKEAVVSLNDGYFCTFTLQRISSFRKSKDFNKDAYALAKYFLEAGLPVSEENFVRFYQQLR